MKSNGKNKNLISTYYTDLIKLLPKIYSVLRGWKVNFIVEKVPLYIWESNNTKSGKNSEAVSMQPTIDQTPITEVVENSVNIFFKENLSSITHERHKLERMLQENPSSGYAIDDLRKIECIVDEAKKAESSIKLSIHSNTHIALEKVTEAIEASKKFLEKYEKEEATLLQKAVFDLKNILDAFKEKLDFLSEKSKAMEEALKKITGTPNLEKNSPRKVFGKWAEFVEIFAQWLEDVTDIIEIPIETVEKFSNGILSLLPEKSSSNQKIDEYKRRLRFSAAYIIKVIVDEKNFNTDRELRREGYTIVKDLRSLAHAQYKIAISTIMSEVNLENINVLGEDEDEIDIDMDKIFRRAKNDDQIVVDVDKNSHETRNRVMS